VLALSITTQKQNPLKSRHRKHVPRETIIKEKVDYSKVQEMINKALQDHLREYHQ